MSDFVTAWRTNGPWLADFVDSATRELSKTGSLRGYRPIFSELATGLNREEVLWLYERLLESRRWVHEWQEEFLAIFPQVTLHDVRAFVQVADERLRKEAAGT